MPSSGFAQFLRRGPRRNDAILAMAAVSCAVWVSACSLATTSSPVPESTIAALPIPSDAPLPLAAPSFEPGQLAGSSVNPNPISLDCVGDLGDGRTDLYALLPQNVVADRSGSYNFYIARLWSWNGTFTDRGLSGWDWQVGSSVGLAGWNDEAGRPVVVSSLWRLVGQPRQWYIADQAVYLGDSLQWQGFYSQWVQC